MLSGVRPVSSHTQQPRRYEIVDRALEDDAPLSDDSDMAPDPVFFYAEDVFAVSEIAPD